jgi:YegS/Rv2252/BmrU family lipid kinase
VKQRIAFLINPLAGTKKISRSSLVKSLNRYLDKSLFDYSIHVSGYPGHNTLVLKELVEKGLVHRVVVSGGDGSVNELLEVLVETLIPLAIFPSGSGNGLARHLGYPFRLKAFIQKLNAAKIQFIDLLSINGQLCASLCGIGFDAFVAADLGRSKFRGFLGYAFRILKEINQYHFFNYNITLPDRNVEGHAFIIDFCNSNQYGYNVKLAPDASLQDGEMDVYIIRKFPKWKFSILVSYVLFNQHHHSRYFETFKAKTLTIKTDRAVHLHIDGEGLPEVDTIEIKVLPGALKMMI